MSPSVLQLAELNRGLSMGGSTVQNFVGVIVTYEFYPVSRQCINIKIASKFKCCFAVHIGCRGYGN